MATAPLARSRGHERRRAAGTDRSRLTRLIVIVLAALVFYLGPERYVLGILSSDHAHANGILSTEQRYASTVSEAHLVEHTLTAALAHARADSAAIPSAADTPGLVSSIQGAANGAGVVVASLTDAITTPQNRANVATTTTTTTPSTTPSDLPTTSGPAPATALTVNGRPLGTIALTVQVHGSIGALDAFLGAVVKIPRLVVVDNVTISQGNSTTPGVYAMTVTGTSYYAPGFAPPAVTQRSKP